MNRLYKYAEHCIKIELMKAKIEVFQNESGIKGVDFIIKTYSGNYHELYLQVLHLEKESSIKIFKEDLKEPKNNLWIVLVVIMKDMDCSLYLIPSTILLELDKYIFIDYHKDKNPYWKISFLIDVVPELSKFSLRNIIQQL